VQEVRQTEIEVLLDRFLRGFEHIHRAVEMMERQRLGPRDPHILPQPLFVTVQFGTRRAHTIGHHRKQRALHGEVQLPVPHMVLDHVGNA
jgi:hypothetical protein